MRSIVIIFLFFGALTAHTQTVPGRKGFGIGVSAGFSSISLTSDLIGKDHEFGLSAPNIKLTWMLSSKSALAVLLPGTVYQHKWSDRPRDRGFEGVVPAFQYWVKDRWWLLGGAGLGMDAPAFYDIKDANERKFYIGGAGVVATGFELWRHGRFALDLQGRLHAGVVNAPEGTRRGAAFSILLGAHWY